MLLQLRIKNFAIIDECLIRFDSGLIALTGETGAGKSIVIDALGACLGSRVSIDSVRTDAERAEVEAIFSIDGARQKLAEKTGDHLSPDDDTLILAREIGRNGRSIGRINGRAVPVSMLASVAEILVDLHGQSDQLSLLKPSRQLEMLDHFAGLDPLRLKFSESARELISARKRLGDFQSGARTAAQRADLLRFQLDEIDGAALRVGEQEELMTERSRLVNGAKLAELASSALEALQGDDRQAGAVAALGACDRLLAHIAQIDLPVGTIQQVAEGLTYQLQDLAASVREYRDGIELDTVRLDDVQSRLEDILRLERKYGESISEVLAFAESARCGLQDVEDYDQRLIDLESEALSRERALAKLAVELSRQRSSASEQFVNEVCGRLQRLGLGPARFEVSLQPVPSEAGIRLDENPHRTSVAFSSTGIDRIQFLVSFNAGESLKPIEKVASGGETARFMLAVKATLASSDDVPTLVFDEIDTGVGGRGALTVGAMLQELGETHQVISITHLPQIAALADQHLKVTKSEKSGQTGVEVLVLDRSARVIELAEMLGGSSPRPAVLKTAEELLSGANL